MSKRSRPYRKVIIVGLDGLDPSLLRELMVRGGLPHLSALASRGTFCDLGTTLPAQTPTAWSTFATGLNAGGHGIYDFIRRDPANYRPDLSLFKLVQRNPLLPVEAVNLRGGRTFWERLAERGIPATVLRCPATFPPRPFRGRLLAGVGVPDIGGNIGKGLALSSSVADPGEATRVPLSRQGDRYHGRLSTRTPLGEGAVDLTLQVSRLSGTASLEIGSVVADMRQQEWSPWLQVAFKLPWRGSVSGLVRVFASRLGDDPLIYLGPINLDPRSPVLPISHPWGYAGELERAIGTFGTLGMLEDHGGLTDGYLDEDAFWWQARESMAERERMFFREVDQLREGLLFCVFDTPDRVQHMFWRYREPSHPSRNYYERSERHADTIGAMYARCDDVVGRTLAVADDETLVMVVSDHGFGSFRRSVELNRWLLAHGWLTLRRGVDPADPATDLLQAIDWDTTRAYALGFGSVYLNLVGREANGIVHEAERAELASRLAGALSGLVDERERVPAVVGVSRAEEVWSGERMSEAPDLVVRFNRGYRAGWRSATGGIGTDVFADNTSRWGGDHIFDPALVPGVLLMNRSVGVGRAPWLADCAPTVLEALTGAGGGREGEKDEMEGRSFLDG
ncbi:MAG: alkaline phosphatase family protein [Gemmatimonadetes bacterium]|nr:alkaline phosphatase family protein [Gemmatimonadota bacterium]